MTHHSAGSLEKRQIDVGFVPLTDCAPLVAALEKGFFEAEGLDVRLQRERSWASIRDKVTFGVFDAAQMLYPMPMAMTLGVGGPATPTQTALVLNLNGNAITLGTQLCEEIGRLPDFESLDLAPPRTANMLRAVIDDRERRDLKPLTFGVVFPTSTHHYELRYWLSAAGIDPDLDVRIIVLPPPAMPEALRDGTIDGCCVGEPWNTLAVQRGWGRVVVSKRQLWNNFGEKVLGVTNAWAEAHPHTHRALLRAVLGAAAWCDEPDNRPELARLVCDARYIGAPVDVCEMALTGRLNYAQSEPALRDDDLVVFHRYAANFPWCSHAVWYVRLMQDAGQIDDDIDVHALAADVLNAELYREVAADLGISAPTMNLKSEGDRTEPWSLEGTAGPIAMGPNLLLDGQRFEPQTPRASRSADPTPTNRR